MKLYIDATGWLAYYMEKHPYSDDVIKTFEKVKDTGGFLYTSDHVIADTLEIIRQRIDRDIAVDIAESMSNSKVLKVIYINEDIMKRAIKLLGKYKDMSFSNCLNYIIMTDLNIESAVSFDGAFRKMSKFKMYPVLRAKK